MAGRGGFLNEAVLIERVVESVYSLDRDTLSGLVRIAVDEGYDPATRLNAGLTVGLRTLGRGFD
jgi:methanogenic corrinoid protein MtbC1